MLKSRISLVAGAVAMFLALPCFAAAQEIDFTEDSLELVQRRLAEKKAVLLDVREKDEWESGRLRDALHLPVSSLEKGVAKEKLEKLLPADKPIYIHCVSGRRALKSAGILKKRGYDVRPLEAGYDDLLEAGFPGAEKQ
jgi:phage shock protein E